MKSSLLILLIILFSLIPATASELGLSLEKQKKFLNELFLKGRYFDYIAEARRLQTTGGAGFPDYCIYSAYYMGGQYGTVINYYNSAYEKEGLSFSEKLLISRSQMKLGNFRESYRMIEGESYNSLRDFSSLSFFLWRVEPLILMDDIDLIRKEIFIADPLLSDDFRFIELRRQLMARENLSMRDPFISGFMSALLPGSGQFYSGYYMEGLLSLLSVTVTLAGGSHYLGKENKGRGGTLIFFSSLFYAGNIYGAVNAAEKRNQVFLNNYRSGLYRESEIYIPGKECLHND